MDHQYLVMMGDDEIGFFEFDEKEKISITFHKGAAGVKETLEFAAQEGFPFYLMHNLKYESKD